MIAEGSKTKKIIPCFFLHLGSAHNKLSCSVTWDPHWYDLQFKISLLHNGKIQSNTTTLFVSLLMFILLRFWPSSLQHAQNPCRDFLFFFGHQVYMSGHAQHRTCVALQQSKTMSHFAPSLLYAVTRLEAIWDKYRGTVEEMINDFIVGFCNRIWYQCMCSFE